jgi:hypothetical protein
MQRSIDSTPEKHDGDVYTPDIECKAPSHFTSMANSQSSHGNAAHARYW